MALSGKNRTGSSLNLDTTVVGLQGFPISATPPAGGQALVFDGTNWVPTVVQTGGGTSVGPTPPASPGTGDQWFDTSNNTLNVWDGTQWVPVDGAGGPFLPLAGGILDGPLTLVGDATSALNPVTLQQLQDAIATIPPPTVGTTPPANPSNGQMWWDDVSGQLFIWYAEADGSSAQWVIANVGIPGPQGPAGAAGPAGPAGPNVMPPGVTDGSNANPGQVGEYLQATSSAAIGIASGTVQTLAQLSLPAGDWDVEGKANVTLPSPSTNLNGTIFIRGIGTTNIGVAYGMSSVIVTSNTFPTFMTTGMSRVSISPGDLVAVAVSMGPLPDNATAAAGALIRARRMR